MRVLVTGHRGYVGSVLTSVLKNAHFDVVGLDSDLYKGCDFGRVQEDIPAFELDIRDLDFTDLLSFDAVVHLASLPEMACENLNPSIIHEVNCCATMHLAECCKQANVTRFLFASSCSVYGRGGRNLLDEQSRVEPLTVHAQSKLWCEKRLSLLADASFVPVFLRNANVYGVSPRLRLDTVVNNFAVCGVTSGHVIMTSSGSAWRPLMHVEDLARTYAAILSAPDEVVCNQVFNVARNDENYRVIDIADAVTELLPRCTRSTAEGAFDNQSSRVDGSKLTEAFPDLSFRWTLPLGIRQLRSATSAGGLTPADWRSDRYRRALHLQYQIDHAELDADLRPRGQRTCASAVGENCGF
ncbi:MAG: SDR family oxidoreductase [Phycisphaerales bacterium]|nr:MAG: SDR family oxidoreductase [Phycisphaerales bacterium]